MTANKLRPQNNTYKHVRDERIHCKHRVPTSAVN